jgi:hypothetical protein
MTFTLPLDLQTKQTASGTLPQLPSELAEEFEAVMERDRQYFLQHPEQDHYFRPITAVEVVEAQLLGRDADQSTQMLVGEVAPGYRMRLAGKDGFPPELEEFRARRQRLRRELLIKPPTLRTRLASAQKRRPKKGFGKKQ